MDKKNKNGEELRYIYQPKIKISISGAAETTYCSPSAFAKSEELGKMVAEKGIILITGATTGAPYWVARAAKIAGGMVIGMSPAVSEEAHLKSYHLPVDYHDFIIYTGFDYTVRNLLLTRSSDAIILVCGRIGTLNEFTIAFENNKPIGILTGSGGIAEEIKGITEKAHRGMGKIVYDSDPKKLLEKVLELIKKDKSKNGTLK